MMQRFLNFLWIFVSKSQFDRLMMVIMIEIHTTSVTELQYTVNFGYKRFRYKGFSLIRDYAKDP